MSKITPTVGRKVWYYASGDQTDPIDATVIKVCGDDPDGPVNLNAIDPDTGAAIFHPNICVGDEDTEGEHYRWMPYQKQSIVDPEPKAKTEAHTKQQKKG